MIPVILSGGSGTRLWPVSRAAYPKQFCELYDGSFLTNSIRRLKTLGDVMILTTESMQALTQRAMQQEGLGKENVLFEPIGKNTAPAIALLCHVLEKRGLANEIVGVFPSDHLIADEKAFYSAVKLAEQAARSGDVVTLGITPTAPATGYGYIEVSDETIDPQADLGARRVKGFREKPSLQQAEGYLASGHHYWNAGMFVFQVSVMVEHFKKLQPKMWEKIQQISLDFANAPYNYALVESISIDYAIMEKLTRQACVPCDIGWSDVGSWDEVARLSDEASQLQSRSKARVFNQDAHNNFVFSVQDKVVGLIDVHDLLVVDTPDALLVVKKGESQKVKDLVGALREASLPQATEHPFESRPWGGFEVLADFPEFKTKRITIDVGAQLSYQSHKKRAEHWVIVKGKAQVILNDQTIDLVAGQSIYVPIGSKHRMRNAGTDPLIFIEVQTGSYFGEDDIVRFADDYNRM